MIVAQSSAARTLVFDRERVSDLWDEAQPLLERHWEEIAHYKDIPLEPMKEAYRRLDDAGVSFLLTARLSGELVGYYLSAIVPNLHYGFLQAIQDVLFVLPEHRKSRIGVGLIRVGEKRLHEAGARLIVHHVKVLHDFGPLLKRLGYEHTEDIYWKRLDHGL